MRRTLTAMLIIFATPALGGATMFDINEFLGFEVQDQRTLHSKQPKVTFQTNSSYDPRIAIPVDAVIVHRHGVPDDDIARTLQSWAEKGFCPQRMFFADSDAGWHYTRGTFDGEHHEDDIELTQDGNQVLCAGVRPYMLPTKGWTEYLKTQVRNAVDGGAKAIYPEEPLAHNFTGYEKSFQEAFEKEYGKPWEAPHLSPDTFFKSARLKTLLYHRLEQELQQYTEQYAKETGNDVDFYIPIHSLYSNLPANLVAPLGTSLSMTGHKGYIGQIWTGPVRWALANYSDRSATFFDSAYLLYDYFVSLVRGSDLVLYLLGDPVEDDLSYRWEEYDVWYKECLAAQLMFPDVNTYEAMPWPDRIFLPGYGTGGGTPGPGRYRTILMSALTALQDMPLGKTSDIEGVTHGVGMLVGDTAMWQNNHHPKLDPFFGALMPLLRKGVPVCSVPAERLHDNNYMDMLRVLIVSYDAWKPEKPEYHEHLKTWVEQGGVLLVFDGEDAFDDIEMFWKSEDFPNPQAHLMQRLGIEYQGWKENAGETGLRYLHEPFGKGHLIVSRISPKLSSHDLEKREELMNLVRECAEKYLGETLQEPGFISVRRGDYLVAHTFESTKTLSGKFLDVYHEDLPLVENPALDPHSSAILLDVSESLKSDIPRIIHATYRLMGSKETESQTTFFIMGPEETDGCVRLFAASMKLDDIQAKKHNGESVECESVESPDGTVLIRFPYDADGIGFCLNWTEME